MRRVAVWHSIRQSAELRLNLMMSASSVDSTGDLSSGGWEDGAVHSGSCSSVLRAAAEEFKPLQPCIDVDWASMQSQVTIFSQRSIGLSSSILGSAEFSYSRRKL